MPVLRSTLRLLALGAGVGLLLDCRTPAPRGEIARITHLAGTVHIVPAGAQIAKAAAGRRLWARDRIVTAGDAWAFIAFADGPKVLVGQGAEFLIEEATEADLFVRLQRSALGARLGKPRGRRLTLHTPSAAADLRPGECVFRLLVDAATGASVWDVIDGDLHLSDNLGREVVVRAGQRVSADAQTGFGGRAPQPFPPGLRDVARPVSGAAAAARSAGGELRLQSPDPPVPPSEAAPANPPRGATGTAGEFAFPPVPRFEELDLLLDDMEWPK